MKVLSQAVRQPTHSHIQLLCRLVVGTEIEHQQRQQTAHGERGARQQRDGGRLKRASLTEKTHLKKRPAQNQQQAQECEHQQHRVIHRQRFAAEPLGLDHAAQAPLQNGRQSGAARRQREPHRLGKEPVIRSGAVDQIRGEGIVPWNRQPCDPECAADLLVENITVRGDQQQVVELGPVHDGLEEPGQVGTELQPHFGVGAPLIFKSQPGRRSSRNNLGYQPGAAGMFVSDATIEGVSISVRLGTSPINFSIRFRSRVGLGDGLRSAAWMAVKNGLPLVS